MKYYTCKCGKCEYFGSGMTPQPCQGCEDCGTNYFKEPLQPHEWKPQYNRDTGEPDRPYCTRCCEFGRKKNNVTT